MEQSGGLQSGGLQISGYQIWVPWRTTLEEIYRTLNCTNCLRNNEYKKGPWGFGGYQRYSQRSQRYLPEDKYCKQILKLMWAWPICQKKRNSWLPTVGLRKDIVEVILAVNFTCCSFPVKPSYGDDARDNSNLQVKLHACRGGLGEAHLDVYIHIYIYTYMFVPC